MGIGLSLTCNYVDMSSIWENHADVNIENISRHVSTCWFLSNGTLNTWETTKCQTFLEIGNCNVQVVLYVDMSSTWWKNFTDMLTWKKKSRWQPYMGTTFPKNHPWRWVCGSRLKLHTPVTTKPEYPPGLEWTVVKHFWLLNSYSNAKHFFITLSRGHFRFWGQERLTNRLISKRYSKNDASPRVEKSST